jgi:hypothetical protein
MSHFKLRIIVHQDRICYLFRVGLNFSFLFHRKAIDTVICDYMHVIYCYKKEKCIFKNLFKHGTYFVNTKVNMCVMSEKFFFLSLAFLILVISSDYFLVIFYLLLCLKWNMSSNQSQKNKILMTDIHLNHIHLKSRKETFLRK